MEQLTDREKQFVAFALFSMAMRTGPMTFTDVEGIVTKLDIMKEFEAYAKSFINYIPDKKIEKPKTGEFLMKGFDAKTNIPGFEKAGVIIVDEEGKFWGQKAEDKKNEHTD